MLFFGFIFITSFVVSHQAFLGGSISWLKWPLGDKVRFTYRLTWEKGTGPCGQNCSPVELYKMGTVPAPLLSLQWTCVSGCSSKKSLSDVNSVLTSVSDNIPGWEQGEKYFFHDNPGTDRYTIRLDGVHWAVPASGSGQMVTTVDLRIRNDSNLPNASPVAAVPPTLGIPFGCPTTITLPVEDPDADDIHSRVAYPDECGDACTTLPKFVLKSTQGQLIIDATRKNGYSPGTAYRVTLMIEDFPTYTIKVGQDTITPRHSISKIPLQFTINVIDDPNSCVDNDLTFVFPTVSDGFRISYPGFPIVGYFQNGVYLESLSSNSTEFMASIPEGMTIEKLGDDRGRLNVSRVYAKWNPPKDQSGDNILCVWGKNHNGITSETRCVVGLINDINGCAGGKVKCLHNGTCVNLWHRTTCKCPHGFKPKDCKHRVTCLDFPCKNNGTCVDTGQAFICVCAPGFTGVDCQTEIDECASNPCHHGKCVNDIGKFSCSCTGNYTGILCVPLEIKESVTGRYEIWPLVVAAIGGTIAIAAAAGCCWWCFLGPGAKRRKKRKNKVQPVMPPTNKEELSQSSITNGSTKLPPLPDEASRQHKLRENIFDKSENHSPKIDEIINNAVSSRSMKISPMLNSNIDF